MLMWVKDFFQILFAGFFTLPQLFSGQFSDRLPVIFMLYTSIAIASLVVLLLYFIVHRKKQPLPIPVLGILGAGWGIFCYVCRGGLGMFLPIGSEYERIVEKVNHFEFLMQQDYFSATPFANWLVPLLYNLVPVYAILTAATLIIGIYNLKTRHAFRLWQVLIVLIPMACILIVTAVSVHILPSTVGDILGRFDAILPLLLVLTLFQKRGSTSPVENMLLSDATGDTLPNRKLDMDQDTDSHYEESEAACLSPGSLVAGKQYVMTTYWYDYRAGAENDSGHITVTPEMSHQFPSLPGGDLNPAQDANTTYSMAYGRNGGYK